MKIILKSRQNGFAIIEALIAFLLLGIGVAALLYLQGNLMSGSSTSKARAEAMELAKYRIELLRNYNEKSEYQDALYSAVQKEPNPDNNEYIQGVNAKYTVNYFLNTVEISKDTDIAAAQLSTTVPQQVTVAVTWDGTKVDSSGPVEETVSLETMLYFMNPVIVSATGSGEGGEGGGFSPLMSPFISGVERKDASTDGTLDTDRSGTDEHRVMLVDADSGTIEFTTVMVDVNTYTNPVTGRSNVEVVVGGEVKLTSFGGIVHKLEGDIIVDPGATSTLSDLTKKGNTLLGLFASPPSYCLFSICKGETDFDPTTDVCEKSNGAEFASYVCYVPGDCTYGSVDSTGAYDSRCPDPTGTLPFRPPPGLDDLNGGWYGRVGNFNVELPQDMVCTADTNLSNVEPPPIRKTPSREFATHRWEECDATNPLLCPKTPFIAGNEGFNRSAIFQTFIIANVDKKVGACLELAKDYDAYERNPNCELLPLSDPPPDISTLTPIGTLMLPPANIIRWVGEGNAIPVDDTEAFPDVWPDPDIWLNPVLPNTVPNVVLPTYTDYCGFVPFP